MAILTTFILTDILITLSSVIFLCYLYVTRKFNYWKSKGVSHNKPIPIFGNFKDSALFRKAPGQFLAEVYNETEGDYKGIYLFDQPSLVLKNTDLIKTILIKDFNYFHDRYVGDNPSYDPAGTYNLFNIKNPDWKQLRTNITPVFTSGKLRQMFNLIEQNGEDLVKHIRNIQHKNEDVKDLAGKYVIDVLVNTVFGLEANCLTDENAPFTMAAKNATTFTFKRSLQFMAYFFAPHIVRPLRFKFIDGEATEFLRSIFTQSMKQRSNSGIKRNDLIDILLKIKNG